MSVQDTKQLRDAPSPFTEGRGEGGNSNGAPSPQPSPAGGEGVDQRPAPLRDERSFLSRWSHRKRAAEAGRPLPEPAAPPTEAGDPADLPDPATLSFDDDFSAYLGARVPAALKRAAMAKLFTDPSFNKMDGLDVYIEDYNLVPDLTAAERELLTHAKEVLGETSMEDERSAQPAEPAHEAEPLAPIHDPRNSADPTQPEPVVSAKDSNEEPGA